MQSYGEIIALIVDTVVEFSDKMSALAPTLEKQCDALKNVAFHLQYSKELIFRLIILIVSHKFEPHVDLLRAQNPALWDKVDFFGFDIKSLWLHPSADKATKDCIWSYLTVIVDTCIQAKNVPNLPETIRSYDRVVGGLLSHSSLIQGPALLALVKSQMGQLTINDST